MLIRIKREIKERKEKIEDNIIIDIKIGLFPKFKDFNFS